LCWRDVMQRNRQWREGALLFYRGCLGSCRNCYGLLLVVMVVILRFRIKYSLGSEVAPFSGQEQGLDKVWVGLANRDVFRSRSFTGSDLPSY